MNTLKASLTLYVISLLISSLTSCYIIITNYNKGLYPPMQDTIAIPILTTITTLAILLLCSAPQEIIRRQIHHKSKPGLAATVTTSIATLLSTTLLIGNSTYWLINSHLLTSALYFLTFAIFFTVQLQLYRQLTLENHVKVKRNSDKTNTPSL